MVKKANEQDVSTIEEILLDAVDWMSRCGLQNQWNESNIRWSNLSKTYKIDDFYIAYYNEVPAACMALTDQDTTYWPELSKGEALYLHKLAVKRCFSGRGFSKELIDFAKEFAYHQSIPSIRLNCNPHRSRLRALYEKEGFQCIGERTFFADTALYVYSTPIERL